MRARLPPMRRRVLHAEDSHDMTSNHLAADARLDAALADTFPASDPVAITICEPPPRPQAGGPPRTTGEPPVIGRTTPVAPAVRHAGWSGGKGGHHAPDAVPADAGPTAFRMRLLIVGVLLLAGLAAHALLRWWPRLEGHAG
ncbi:hypothetical protein [Siccirubricoccus sp. G192]|uniref:hypothetical protein n=1 Tax=Siccirubricoccus sp. G192 TaxID=2849651 RepID=UPI001C2C98DD|nr:hypothetical protein [Siccirubricoccus sp. G192]MBV1796186.1 hypothetical protein [Siccirubricoccus sp. G192]